MTAGATGTPPIPRDDDGEVDALGGDELLRGYSIAGALHLDVDAVAGGRAQLARHGATVRVEDRDLRLRRRFPRQLLEMLISASEVRGEVLEVPGVPREEAHGGDKADA